MCIHKISQKCGTFIRKYRTQKAVNKFFIENQVVRNSKRVNMNTPEMREMDAHLKEVERDFRRRAALSEIEAKKIFFNA